MIELNAREVRLALVLMNAGDGSGIRPGRDTAEHALALLERLRAYVKCDGEKE